MDLPLFFTLPLIGGFAFVTGFFLLRWRSARQDGQRLYYRAAVWGGLLTIAAVVIHLLCMRWSVYRQGFEWLYGAFLQPLLTAKDPPPLSSLQIRAHVALVCVYALLLGIGIPALSRGLLWAAGRGLMRVTGLNPWLVKLNLATITDPLERLLSRALVNAEAVQVTLSTGKVYVGYVLEALDPDLPTKFIKLQPLMSGQRSDSGQVHYTTFYDQILADFEANPATKAAADSFQVVIPVDKITTLSGFDLDAYVHFLAETESRIESKAADTDPASATAVAPWLALAVAAAALLRK